MKLLITGAGGSIGSALARHFYNDKLILLGHSEEPLYRLNQMLPGHQLVLADVRHRSRLIQVLQHYQPDMVVHTAAIKHIPYAEANPNEAILTNMLGTRNLIEAMEAVGIDQLIHISTDKAVFPSCVMGKTKRIAEYLCACSSLEAKVLRLGNVPGSSGSVIPLFRRQIAEGGPVTVTHHEMTRYFISVEEVCRCVDMLIDMTSGLYIPKMGLPISIKELAEGLIAESGQDISIEYTGLRPGEKIEEDLYYPDEITSESQEFYIGKINAPEREAWDIRMDQIGHLALQGKEKSVELLDQLIESPR